MVSAHIENEIRGLYTSTWKQHTDDRAKVVLSVADENIVIAQGKFAEPDHVWVLPIGTKVIATRYFRHSPPSAFELENAIQTVEDEIALLHGIEGTWSRLFTRDSAIHEIALLAGVAGTPMIVMGREAVEGVFSRMASVAEGQPASYASIPTNPEFLATLLILRELMHHLNFSEISCV